MRAGVAGSSGDEGSVLAGASGGAAAMGGGSEGAAEDADFGCHFLRSGTECTSAVAGCGLAGVVEAMGCSWS